MITREKKEEAKPIWEPARPNRTEPKPCKRGRMWVSEIEKDEKSSWFDVNWNKINPLNSKMWCAVSKLQRTKYTYFIKIESKQRPNADRVQCDASNVLVNPCHSVKKINNNI